MVSVWPPVLGAAGLLFWPSTRSGARLRSLMSVRESISGSARMRRWRVAVMIVVLLAFAAWAAGPGGVVAALVLTRVCRSQLNEARETKARLARAEGFAEAVRAMVAELRAGAHPVAAAEAAAAEAVPEAASAMRAVAMSAKLDGDFGPEITAGALGRLATAWNLARRHGLPMADVLDAVRRDVEAEVRFARQIGAKMAGPRASAVVLAFLPLIGIALGEAMGAHPVRVLTSTGAGQVLLVLGALLIMAGLSWVTKLTKLTKLTGRAVPE